MENVERANESSSYAEARSIFKTAGYGLTEVVLTASYYGVPQRRKRFFCIGFIGAENGFLSECFNENKSSSELTVRGYLGDTLGIEHFFLNPRNYNSRGVTSIHEPCLTIRGNNQAIPHGYKRHPGDTADIASGLVRPLTSVERSYIQTFPPDFKWVGCKTDIEQMIGNAVPVKLAEFVAGAIKRAEGDAHLTTEGVMFNVE